MSIDRLDFDNISEEDLEELKESGVPEGLNIDYKRDPYKYNDAGKKEFLKDVSSFANASGGQLLIGIEEDNGVPTTICGVNSIDPDADILRMDQIIRSGLEPRIVGSRIKQIKLKNGKYVFLMRIPKSWNPPHRVIFKNYNRFYLRNSGGVHEASVEELRHIFLMTNNLRDRIISFRNDRIKKIIEDQDPPYLDNNGRVFIHMVPFAALETPIIIDLRDIHWNRKFFNPIGDENYSTQVNFDGIQTYFKSQSFGCTQVFRNGIIEATKANIILNRNYGRMIPGDYIHKELIKSIINYLRGLNNLGISTPIMIMVTLEGVKGVYLTLKNFDSSEAKVIDRSLLKMPEVIVNDYSNDQDYQKLLKPIFDSLCNSVGHYRSDYFTDQGIFTG